MKKTLVLITTLLLLVSLFTITASAAVLPTPWSDNTMKVFILDDYNGITPGAITLAYISEGTNATAEYKNDQLWITSCDNWAGNIQFGVSGTAKTMTKVDENNYPSAAQGVVGFGFYFKNTTAEAIGLVGHWYDDVGFFTAQKDAVYYYVDMEGNVSENKFADNGFFGIGAGGEGYVLIPFASLKDGWNKETPEQVQPSKSAYLSLYLGPVDGSNGGALIIDDLFAYGTSAMEGEVLDIEDPSDEADISVIAYAAAAIAGLGALAIAKKR